MVFPFQLELENLNDQESEITTKFLVCDDICVPEEATLLLKLKNQILNIEERPDLLKKWRNLVPIRAPPDTFVSSIGTLFTVESKSISSQSQFFPFDENTMDFSSEQISENGNLSFEVFEDFTGTLKGVISSENSFFEVDKAGTVSVNSDVGISLLTAILLLLLEV